MDTFWEAPLGAHGPQGQTPQGLAAIRPGLIAWRAGLRGGRLVLGGSLLALALGPPALAASPPVRPSVEPTPPPPTFLLWTLAGRPVGGVSFGPTLFHLSVGASALVRLLGPHPVTGTDGWGMRKLGWPALGVEATASPDGRLLAMAFLLAPQGRGSVRWAAANVGTDRGLRPGVSLSQARSLQGTPTRTRPATDGPGVVWVYSLARGSELELAFPRNLPNAKAISLTLY